MAIKNAKSPTFRTDKKKPRENQDRTNRSSSKKNSGMVTTISVQPSMLPEAAHPEQKAKMIESQEKTRGCQSLPQNEWVEGDMTRSRTNITPNHTVPTSSKRNYQNGKYIK
jgi:hypothetical protein